MATHDTVLGTLLGSFSLAQDAGVRIGFDGLVCLSFAQQISDSVNYSGSPLDGAAFLPYLLLSRVGQFACHKKGLEQAGQRGAKYRGGDGFWQRSAMRGKIVLRPHPVPGFLLSSLTKTRHILGIGWVWW